jgi:hypothetical protein
MGQFLPVTASTSAASQVGQRHVILESQARQMKSGLADNGEFHFAAVQEWNPTACTLV